MSPETAKKMRIVKNYVAGKLRCAEFAVTNSCIAQCSFCGIWKQQPKVFVDRTKALQAIDRMADLGVSHITFTGGEPLLHPDIIDFVARATKRKIHNVVLDAVPRLLTRNDMIPRLAAAGCDMVSISFDSGDPETMAKSRRVEGIMDEMAEAMAKIRGSGLKTMASVLIWNDNFDKLEQVFQNAKKMGYDFISLNYPTFSDSPVYELGGEGISFSKEDVIKGLQSAIELKKTGKYDIINMTSSMENIIDYLRDPASAKFPCHGGKRVLFVDWFFNVYPCMQLPTPLGNILTINQKALDIPPCNQCSMSWYRDLSMFFGGAKSLAMLFNAAKESKGFI